MAAAVDIRAQLTQAGVSDLRTIRTIEFLVAERRLDPAQLERLITLSTEREESLINLVLEMEMVSERELLEIRAQLLGWETVALTEAEIEEEMARALITPQQATEWRLLPYSRNNFGDLLVAIGNAENVAAIDGLQKALPAETIRFQLALQSELNRVIEQIYDPEGAGKMAAMMAAAEASEEEEEETLLRVRDAAADSAIITMVDNLIRQSRDMGASDIHIEPHEKVTKVRFRIDGTLREVSTINLKQTPKVIARIKHMAGMRPEQRREPQDGRVVTVLDDVPLDLRTVTYPSVYGETVTMRLLDSRQAMLPLDALGMREHNLKRYLGAIKKPYGCCLVVGPTGSGKSTTLYSSLGKVLSPAKKAISIEDPVEYRLEGLVQIDIAESRRAADSESSLNFANALRSIMRGDPDIIMVGEIRDQETAAIAVQAALTGHFLYSTLHANDAISTLSRMEKLGVPRYLISESVQVIVAQRLIRKLCHCKVEMQATPDILRAAEAPQWAIDKLEQEGPRIMYKPSPDGCDRCQGAGYKGRSGIHEVVTFDEEFRHEITEGADASVLERHARRLGMRSLSEDAFDRAWEGVTSLDEVARVVV